MVGFFPKKISYSAIAIYFTALTIISLCFNRYAMRLPFMILGAIEVLGFFLMVNHCSKSWSHINRKTFTAYVFITAICLRLVWVFFSYYFYISLTGRPFEPGAADALGYHSEASWLQAESWSKIIDYYFHGATISDSGYGMYLTVLYKVFGPSVILPRILKSLYSAITCVLLYKLTSRCIDETTGRIAAIIGVFMPNLIIYCGLHLKETEMLFLLVAFLERADFFLHTRRYSIVTISVPLLLAGSLFFFRTVLGAIAILAYAAALLFSSSRIVGKTKKILGYAFLAVSIVVMMGGTIATEVEGYLEERTVNQSNKRLEQTLRGNQWAKYATGTVLAPMMFVMPFSTMVDVDEQYNQQIIHGGNYVRNFMGFFVIFAIISALFITKDWRKLTLVGAYAIGYLIVLSASGFANSERFLLPALPGLIVMWSYGLTRMNVKSVKWMKPWMFVVLFMQLGWAFFKLGSRGLF